MTISRMPQEARPALLYLLTCISDAQAMLNEVTRVRMSREHTPPLPDVTRDPEAYAAALARWLETVTGPWESKLAKQRAFRQAFGSQLQRRWFN